MSESESESEKERSVGKKGSVVWGGLWGDGGEEKWLEEGGTVITGGEEGSEELKMGVEHLG